MASHRRPTQSGLTHSARVTVLSAAAATAAATFGATPAGADPHTSPERARATVDRLFKEAEVATESFNSAGERVAQLREEVDEAQDGVARGQERINRMREALGSVAGAQYRSGGVDPTLSLLLSSDPDTFLAQAEMLHMVTERQHSALLELQRAQRSIGQLRTEAARDLSELERSRDSVARHKRAVERKLAQAQRLLNSLPAGERGEYDRASRSGRGALPALSGDAPASARAATAVSAARSAVGRPYVWGANGPSGFDCSGLMQWSYARAGVGLPRTSQAQRYAGRQVPLSEARPGDLVAYRADASHIGMYMGNGQVVHAPYPGASVRYDPVGMMPISSITRV
ncbi:NlpC/P60 family protein [Streptomyces albipurpureus]|uniref:NlpC/P60 family protein n=1 Tax=Streptomyces albipurpureus TaxID=2897419 RepID=A0ABT0UV65_9ACTN|nr:C40 family peptidase [Streptomyces sp. CWNU-1]MCM2392467.1 NlpC/P60 family protein [Streptomyces sp. CWNU-1]